LRIEPKLLEIGAGCCLVGEGKRRVGKGEGITHQLHLPPILLEDLNGPSRLVEAVLEILPEGPEDFLGHGPLRKFPFRLAEEEKLQMAYER